MKKKRILLILLAAVPVLLLLVVAAVQVLAPVVLNRDPVKGRIEALVSRKTGATLSIERIDLSLFPVFFAGVRGASISAPGKGEGSIQSLDIFPEFLPLLIGRLKVKAIRATTPEFTVLLPRASVQGDTDAAAKTAFTEMMENVLGPALGPLFPGPGLVLNIENGRLDLVKNGKSSLLIRNVNARILFSDALTAPVRSSSRISDDAYGGTPGRHFNLTVTIAGLEADSPLLPGSLRLTCKTIGVLNNRLSFTDLRIQVEKTELALSGTIHEVRQTIDSLEVSVDGNVDPSVSRWIVGLSGLDRDFEVLPSLKLEKIRTAMDQKTDLISVQGTATADGDVALAVDFSNSRAGLNVRKFSLKDQFSDAVMSLSIQDRVALLEFKGKIAKATLDRLLSLQQIPNGEVHGNIRARILLDQLGASTASGTLAGTNVVFPATLNLPISFEQISLKANNNVIAVEASLHSI
ncbi:MAG TPA: AsmA family protein, partial [Nitrospiria bacterium]|nr:AsmA family protein [Nitrospiria bacterium]